MIRSSFINGYGKTLFVRNTEKDITNSKVERHLFYIHGSSSSVSMHETNALSLFRVIPVQSLLHLGRVLSNVNTQYFPVFSKILVPWTSLTT